MGLVDIKSAPLYLNTIACEQIKRMPVRIKDCPKRGCKFYRSQVCKTCLRNINRKDRFEPVESES